LTLSSSQAWLLIPDRVDLILHQKTLFTIIIYQHQITVLPRNAIVIRPVTLFQ